MRLVSLVLTSTIVFITFNSQLSNIDASCVEPGHLATMLVNLYLKKRFPHEYTSQNIFIYNLLIYMTQKLLRIQVNLGLKCPAIQKMSFH